MGFPRAWLGLWRRTSWKTRVVVAVLAADAAVAVAGIGVVPAVLRAQGGLAAMLGVVAAQAAIAVVAVAGPVRLDKRSPTAGISLAAGALFAACYVGLLAAELAGAQLSIDRGAVTVYALFAAAGVLAGALASWRTRRLADGPVAGCWGLVTGTALWSLGWVPLTYALWGGAGWYRFWLQDGAIADFHRSGGQDLSAFLLQDIYGAMVAHQLLSVVIGAISGLAGSALVRVPMMLASRLRGTTATSPPAG